MDEVADVHCAQCGNVIPESPGPPVEERMPCPEGDSTARRFSETLSATVSVRAFLDGKKKSSKHPSRKRVRVHLQVGD